jgi:hypothetical protein
MTLPVSPNSISLSQVNIELGFASNTAISMNDTAVRALFGRTSGTISMSDGWGKSSVVKLGTPTFTAATGGAGTVSFTWNAITSATSYDVTFNGTTTNQTSTTFARTSGVNAGSYALSVVAKATGFTSSDAGVSTTVNVTSPKLATPLYSVVAGGVNSVSFAWTAVSNATSYDVTFNGNTTTQTGLTFNIASGVAAGTYSLSVVAKAANYTNSDAATSGNIIVTNAKLSTPSFTAATGSVNQVSFTWSAVTNATSYDVTFNSVTTTQTSTTFTSVNTLTPGTYYLFVKAKAANYPDSDVGTSSAVATATNVLGTLNVSVSGINSGSATVSLTYTGTYSIGTYYIDLFPSLSNTGTPLASYSGASSTHVFSGLAASTKYYVDVAAQFSTGGGFNKGMNETDTFTTIASATPPSATVITAGTRTARATGNAFPTWYSFTPTTSGSYTFVLTSAVDPFVEIYDSSGMTIQFSDDDSAYLNNSQATGTLAANTTYLIKARAFSPPNSGAHALSIYGGSCTAITTTGTTQGAVAVATSNVTYRFTPAVGKTYQFALTGAIGDNFMLMYDYTGTLLIQDDDSGGAGSALFSYGCLAGQDYYIKCMGYSSQTGVFNLTIT